MKDRSGIPFTPPSNRGPVTSGTKVTIHTPSGPKPGTMGGGGQVIRGR